MNVNFIDRGWPRFVAHSLITSPEEILQLETSVNRRRAAHILETLMEQLLLWLDESGDVVTSSRWAEDDPRRIFLQSCLHRESDALDAGIRELTAILNSVLIDATGLATEHWHMYTPLAHRVDDFPVRDDELCTRVERLIAKVIERCDSVWVDPHVKERWIGRCVDLVVNVTPLIPIRLHTFRQLIRRAPIDKIRLAVATYYDMYGDEHCVKYLSSVGDELEREGDFARAGKVLEMIQDLDL